MTTLRTAPGTFTVDHDGRQDIVYAVRDAAGTRWVFWQGQVYRVAPAAPAAPDLPSRPAGSQAAHAAQTLTAPMPATVLKVLVTPGARVAKGDTVVLLEAMKMELPIRAPADGKVRAVNCREGDLVQPDVALVEFE